MTSTLNLLHFDLLLHPYKFIVSFLAAVVKVYLKKNNFKPPFNFSFLNASLSVCTHRGNLITLRYNMMTLMHINEIGHLNAIPYHQQAIHTLNYNKKIRMWKWKIIFSSGQSLYLLLLMVIVFIIYDIEDDRMVCKKNKNHKFILY